MEGETRCSGSRLSDNVTTAYICVVTEWRWVSLKKKEKKKILFFFFFFFFRETPTSPWFPFRAKFRPLGQLFRPIRPLAWSLDIHNLRLSRFSQLKGFSRATLSCDSSYCLCPGMLISAKVKNNRTLMWKKVRNLRLELFESYSSFSYCTHSSVYWVFWSSDRVVDCNISILFRSSTTGPQHPIYRTMHTVWKVLIAF